MTKVIEVYEEEQAQNQVTVDKEEEESSQLMIWIPAAIVGLLILVAVIMVIRVFVNKRNKQELVPIAQQLEKVKTEVVDIEPQFVLEGDQSSNIFARTSNAFALGGEAIERSEVEKPGTATTQEKRKKKTKKIIIRKRK